MEIIEVNNNQNIITCERCSSKVKIGIGDLRWTHCEEDYYYIKCPVCNETIWIKSNEYFDQLWTKQNKVEQL